MISVTNFARGFQSFWSNITPWFHGYVGSINKGQIERFKKPLVSKDLPINRSINNTIAVLKFVEACKSESLNEDLKLAEINAKAQLRYLPRSNCKNYSMGSDDIQQIIDQARRLFVLYSKKLIVPFPFFPGCRVILTCQGDLLYSKTLVEVKAGERDLVPSDIRQTLTYLALNSASKKPISIENIEIVNPRQGTIYYDTVDNLCDAVSDRTKEDIFLEINSFAESYSLIS